MRARVGVAMAAGLFGLTEVTYAGQTIASAPVLNNTTVACYVRNVGTIPVSITVLITDETGTPLLNPSFQNCDVPLAPGRTCVVLAGSGAAFLACSATVSSGSARNLRGTVEARSAGLHVTHAEELR